MNWINRILSHREVQKRPYLVQFVKFSIVGVIGTTIDFGFLNLLVIVFGLNVYLSATFSFILAVINNFIFNKYWTFSDKKGRNFSLQFLQFGIVSIIGLGINLAVMYLLIHFVSLWYNWAKVFATIIVLFWNFLGNKYWTFKK